MQCILLLCSALHCNIYPFMLYYAYGGVIYV
nr:MAG TPA: hypothetical protein [Caudoviricetes sp.]